MTGAYSHAFLNGRFGGLLRWSRFHRYREHRAGHVRAALLARPDAATAHVVGTRGSMLFTAVRSLDVGAYVAQSSPPSSCDSKRPRLVAFTVTVLRPRLLCEMTRQLVDSGLARDRSMSRASDPGSRHRTDVDSPARFVRAWPPREQGQERAGEERGRLDVEAVRRPGHTRRRKPFPGEGCTPVAPGVFSRARAGCSRAPRFSSAS